MSEMDTFDDFLGDPGMDDYPRVADPSIQQAVGSGSGMEGLAKIPVRGGLPPAPPNRQAGMAPPYIPPAPLPPLMQSWDQAVTSRPLPSRAADPRIQQAVAGFGQNDGSSMGLGLKLLAIAAGGAIGGYYGGLPGAGAGALFGGALGGAGAAVQAYRTGENAAPAHLLGAAAAAGAGGFIWWKFVQGGAPTGRGRGSRRYLTNPKDADTIKCKPCDIRRAGP